MTVWPLWWPRLGFIFFIWGWGRILPFPTPWAPCPQGVFVLFKKAENPRPALGVTGNTATLGHRSGHISGGAAEWHTTQNQMPQNRNGVWVFRLLLARQGGRPGLQCTCQLSRGVLAAPLYSEGTRGGAHRGHIHIALTAGRNRKVFKSCCHLGWSMPVLSKVQYIPSVVILSIFFSAWRMKTETPHTT